MVIVGGETETLRPPREIVLLVNEEAFGVKAGDADRMARLCREFGFTVVDVARPESPDEMAALAAQYAGQVPGLLVMGGDGALNLTLPGCLGKPVAVGMLPRGTVNVWAREIGLPVRPEAAVAALATGTVELFDVGKVVWPAAAVDAHFLLMAGFGFDGEVTRLVDRNLKRWVGLGAYVVASVAAYFRHEPYAARIEVDGVARRLELTQLVAANCRRYGGDLPLIESADPADGLLDLWTLGPAPKWQHAARFVRIVATQADPGDRLLPARARRLRIEADNPVAVQLDGDPQPALPGPIDVSIVPRSFRAWLPRRL